MKRQETLLCRKTARKAPICLRRRSTEVPPDLLLQQGFTIIELIVVAAILGVLTLMIIPSYNMFVKYSKDARCAAEIRSLQTDINSYLVDHADIPNSLADIGRAGLLDPYGQPYQYLRISNNPAAARVGLFLVPLNTDYDLYSFGEDGIGATDLLDPTSADDIVRASEGGFIGTATAYLSP